MNKNEPLHHDIHIVPSLTSLHSQNDRICDNQNHHEVLKLWIWWPKEKRTSKLIFITLRTSLTQNILKKY